MKKLYLALFLIPVVLNAVETPSATPNLDEQLNALGTPGDQAPAGVTSEQLYAVQNRYSSLKFRPEVALGGGTNFSSDGFLRTGNIDAAIRFHFSDRWFVGGTYNFVVNEFTRNGDWLVNELGRPADVAVTYHRLDLGLGYNLFYGKFRLTMDQVFYFDQYIALGPGLVLQDISNRWAGVVDVGFAFRFGRNATFRLGVKDYIFDEQRRLTSGIVNNFVGYLQAGYVFGG